MRTRLPLGLLLVAVAVTASAACNEEFVKDEVCTSCSVMIQDVQCNGSAAGIESERGVLSP